ncbi:MAG: hypothetical protein ACFE96_16800 [Candidatus Hermodarchaeota archaeon]
MYSKKNNTLLFVIFVIFLSSQTILQVNAAQTSLKYPSTCIGRGYFTQVDRLKKNDDLGAICTGWTTWGKIETKYSWGVSETKTVTEVYVQFEAKACAGWGRIRIYCYDSESNEIGHSPQSDLINPEWGYTFELTADMNGDGVVIKPDDIRVYIRAYKGWFDTLKVDWVKARAIYN